MRRREDKHVDLLRGYGDGKFSFSAWDTLFSDAPVEIQECRWSVSDEINSPLQLSVQVRVKENDTLFELVFVGVDGHRMQDEFGLWDYWEKTEQLGGRPAHTCFQVRNSQWTKESIATFEATDGWAYVLATSEMCLEVVCNNEPFILQIE